MQNKTLTTPHARQIAIWILRIFSEDMAGAVFLDNGRYADVDIPRYLGLPVPLEKKDVADLPNRMAAMLQELESAGDAGLDELARDNFSQFAAVFQLNPAETAVLTLLGMIEVESVLADCMRVAGRFLTGKPTRVMAHVLGLPQCEVDAAMSKGSKLMTCGAVRNGSRLGIEGRIPKFFNQAVAHVLTREPFDSSRLFSAMGVKAAEPPRLGLEDFPHLKSELAWLVEYLRAARREQKTGVNILLYGAPGTGKTQLTRTIGREAGLPVFDFATQDDDGDPLDPSKRLVQVRIGATFFRDSPGLYVFDEFEDIIRPSPSGPGAVNESKSWFNNLLESNRQPVFWLANSIVFLDEAFARRFDFIIEVPVPPRKCRESILRKELGKLVSESAIRQLAEVGTLAPAVVTRVSSVIGGVGSTFPETIRDEMAVRMIGSVLKAQQHPLEQPPGGEILTPGVYDVSLLNVDADLNRMSAMLRANPQARICLHGPPGTGKTALGHWLAREIDRPIHLKRASDMLSPFVGGTEQLLASAFEEARTDDAILMIDEVDSFLQDRSKAVRGWEVTQVNELLTRMESFSGVFIATTNRLEHLDSASLRRFDLKLHFDYLRPDQIHELLGKWCFRLGIPLPDREDPAMLSSMDSVTPGDFTAVARRHRFQPFTDGAEFFQALKEDCAMKTHGSRRIGFR